MKQLRDSLSLARDSLEEALSEAESLGRQAEYNFIDEALSATEAALGSLVPES